MLVSCWSVKGGSGTTVVAASLALMLAKSAPDGVLLVDLGGDVPAVLGMSEPSGPGVAEWLDAGSAVPVEGWGRLEVPATSSVHVIPRGVGPLCSRDRIDVLVGLLANEHRPVVIDCGVVGGAARTDEAEAARACAASATHSLLVVRSCYLAMRRALRSPVHPSGIVLLREVGRSFDGASVQGILGAPVIAEVEHDPAIGRAVDAGLLAGRLPRGLERALQHAA